MLGKSVYIPVDNHNIEKYFRKRMILKISLNDRNLLRVLNLETIYIARYSGQFWNKNWKIWQFNSWTYADNGILDINKNTAENAGVWD